MDHNFLLPNDLCGAAALEKVLELLLAFVAADSVYFSPHLEQGPNEGVFLVVLGDECTQYWDEVHHNCEKLFDSYPQFSFRVYDREWITDELNDGNPFFVLHCNRQFLLYHTSGSAEIALLDSLKPKRFAKSARNRFRVDDETAFTVAVDLRHYIKAGNLLQAAYTLHQSIRWLFITASRFLTGEWLVADDLQVQQEHVGFFSVALGNTFNVKLPEDVVVLELLNGACKAIKSDGEVPVLTLELLRVLELRKEAMRKEVHRLFEACMERCRYQFFLKKQPLIVLDEADPLHYIATVITDMVSASALYCLGEHRMERKVLHHVLADNVADSFSTHYYLLLFVNDYVQDAPGNISDKISTLTNGRYAVTVLLHGKKSLGTRNSDQQYFFYNAMERGRLLFKESARPPYLPFATPPSRNIGQAKRYVEQRNKTVAFFIETENRDVGNATKMKVYLLHLIVEHTCLGLIRLHLGYTPNHFSLSFLFDLCEYFSPLTRILFPRETDKDKELLRLLSLSPNALRYGVVDDVAHHDYELLRNRCMEFVEKARVEGRN